ncbi:hypothetical protein TRFO_01428 [Tritrichomonas foetus]|uniref:Uncharacterized protein n=1 Tax=Tritrichomonas foetus TaxID=1144522 RepID=A0A1J4K206_9EUKA|nr:hypothetical protein TRFO_01428 [Tritrichomonas foetus]|eukprot:OHT03772.1 hypothetical protein TRFO_01428 [Tritrichomonas foetus]
MRSNNYPPEQFGRQYDERQPSNTDRKQNSNNNRFFYTPGQNASGNPNQGGLNLSLNQPKQQPNPPSQNYQRSKGPKGEYNSSKKGNYIQYEKPPKQSSIKIEVPRSTTPNIQFENIKKRGDSDAINIANICPPRTNSSQIKIEHSNIVTRSSSGDVKAPSKSTEPKIKIERSQPESKTIILSNSSISGELCPFCGVVSLPFYDLMNHIIIAHKLNGLLEETFRSSKSPGICSKCMEGVSDAQFVMHCIHAHEVSVLEMFRDRCIEQFSTKQNEIESFIETHAPHINPKFKRTFDISSSSESDDDDDDIHKDQNPQSDDEYNEFIASTIHSNGIAAKSTVKQIPELLFDPTKFESKKDDTPSNSAKDYVNKLADIEIFMRLNNMYYEQPNHFVCKLCKKKCDTLVRLVDHFLQQHRLKITSEIRKSLCVMSKEVSMTTDERELMKIPKLYLCLTLYPILKANDVVPTIAIDVPQIYADFLLEALSVTQPVVNAFHTPKIFTQPTTIMVRLPTPLPLVFSQSSKPNYVTIGFVDTTIIDAKSIRNIVSDTLNSLAKTEIFDAKFEKIDADCGFTDDQLIDLCDVLNVDLLKTDDIIDPDGKTRSFSILIMIQKWSLAQNDETSRELRTLFDEADMAVCKKCHEPFNIQKGGECVGPKVSGLTIKVKGGVHEADQEISSCTCNKIMLKEWRPI